MELCQPEEEPEYALSHDSADEDEGESSHQSTDCVFGVFDELVRDPSTKRALVAEETEPPCRVRGLVRGHCGMTDFDLQGVISTGLNHTLFRAAVRSSGDEVGIKQVTRRTCQLYGKQSAELKAEITQLRDDLHGGCQNVVALLDVFLHDDAAYVVVEQMNCGNIMRLRDVQLPVACIAYILHEVLEGLFFLHSLGRLYRDMRPENILMNAKGAIKLAEPVAELTYTSMLPKGRVVKDRAYCAPERIAGQPYDVTSDVFSVGIVAYELAMNGQYPFTEAGGVFSLLSQIVGGQHAHLQSAEVGSEALCDFYEQCMIKEGAQRPKVDALLQHPFLDEQCPGGAKQFGGWLAQAGVAQSADSTSANLLGAVDDITSHVY